MLVLQLCLHIYTYIPPKSLEGCARYLVCAPKSPESSCGLALARLLPTRQPTTASSPSHSLLSSSLSGITTAPRTLRRRTPPGVSALRRPEAAAATRRSESPPHSARAASARAQRQRIFGRPLASHADLPPALVASPLCAPLAASVLKALLTAVRRQIAGRAHVCPRHVGRRDSRRPHPT